VTVFVINLFSIFLLRGYWYNHVTEIIEESNEPSFYFNPTVFTKKCIRQGVSPMPETIDAVVVSHTVEQYFGIHEHSNIRR
jgi:hypothetical protein